MMKIVKFIKRWLAGWRYEWMGTPSGKQKIFCKRVSTGPKIDHKQ